EPGLEARKAKGAPFLRGRQGVDAKASFGDDAEGSFAAHEELGQVGSGGSAGTMSFGPYDAAIGEHDFEAEHHVLDLPVAGRVLPRTTAGQPSADGRQVH